MKYFIGYLIQGKAAIWYVNLAKNISERFNTWKLYEKIPPHITIFQPFDTDDISSIEDFLTSWIQNKSIPGKFVLSGFDRFDDKVLFAKVETDQSVKGVVEELRRNIKRITGMPEEDFPIWHPHTTLADHLSPQEINQIWNYVSRLEKPNFILPFDNVTIFRFGGNRKWIVEESFKFNSSI